MGLGFEDNIFKDIDTTVKPATPPTPTFDPHFPQADPDPGHQPFDPMGPPNFTPATGDGK